MDALDQLAAPATELLGRVDAVLAAAGAPTGHRIWPLLRRLRTLPGDAADAVLALRAAPLVEAGDATRRALRGYDEAHLALSGDLSWQGPAAEAFAARCGGLDAYLADGPESLTGRVHATAAYAEAVAEWIIRTRGDLARTLGDVLGSAEAVTVVVAPRPVAASTSAAPAAAEIGARVLATVAEAYAEAAELPGRWAPALAEVAYRPSRVAPARFDAGRIVR
ncbi:hypothetical protein [Plantactinospora sp. CA-290183]|uniref:hypothetical protein n=1 Tax=Plantactinospora sp. CA-290183 TaxID=3240006 RepID=UPI003D8D8867